MSLTRTRVFSALAGFALLLCAGGIVVSALQRAGVRSDPAPVLERTSTLLPDGRTLVTGGGEPAAVWDPATRVATPTAGQLQVPRSGHSATVLADGTVLILGGRDGDGFAEVPELFDPATGLFTAFSLPGGLRRASHTTTLLPDGRLVVIGGIGDGRAPLATEVLDVVRSARTVRGAPVDRAGHQAVLDGERIVITGGHSMDGTPRADRLVFDPASAATVPDGAAITTRGFTVERSDPENGARDVPVGAIIGVQFSQAVSPRTITDDTVQLTTAAGPHPAKTVLAEGGRLLFVRANGGLVDNTEYRLQFTGLTSTANTPLPTTVLTFTTKASDRVAPDSSDEEWSPNLSNATNPWRTGRAASPWESLPPLMAAAGQTAISGRVLTLDGRPLPDVTLEVEDAGSTRSDRTGRFLLPLPPGVSGRVGLHIAGETASTPGRHFGFFEYGTTIRPGQTLVLPFTIWMPRLDMRHAVSIPSPTIAETTVTTPLIPGLELHIPPNTVIRDEEGEVVRQLTITPIPVDRPPFPLPEHFEVPIYFTIQPGGAYVYTPSGGARLIYPNYKGYAKDIVAEFWHYDPDEKGWFVYGTGSVSPSGTQVIPAPGVSLYEFTGAMINGQGTPPSDAPEPGAPRRADPVDLGTGLFVLEKTDLSVTDVLPLALKRTYRPNDSQVRPFGIGATHNYAMFLWSAAQYQQADLILPDGGRVHYVRTSSGTGFTDAVFEHTATPTAFYKSTIVWNGNGWDLTLKDGTVFVFGDTAPIQSIRDRYGNTITYTWSAINSKGSGTGNILKLSTSNGRFIEFTYDTSNRITQLKDNMARTVGYTYDASGRLSTVTDPANGVTTYTYDSSNRMLTITDARNITYLTNHYDASGRVDLQTLADTGTYALAYTTNGSGNITQVDLTNPRGFVDRWALNTSRYPTSHTEAYGTSLARTTTFTRQSGTNLLQSTTDALGRETAYGYDSSGNVTTITRLSGTSNAVTTTLTYAAAYNQVETITDPLEHVTTFAYDTQGRLTSVTDPLQRETTFTYNAAGQPVTVTDPLEHTTQLTYTYGDLTSVTNPLMQATTRFTDVVGRPVALTNALGEVTQYEYDALDRVTKMTDARSGQTSFAYDANSNLTSLTDALAHGTTWAYDDMDRVGTRTDPLTHGDSRTYDENGNLSAFTDRKGQVTAYEYDALDRLTRVTYDDTSTIDYTYDAGDRLVEIDDSANGTITRTYDDLDQLTEESTAQGTVTYTYDDDGRRATVTVAGQSAVTYTYDDAHRLTTIAQGSATVSLTYDAANRRSTLTYPNGIVVTYGYDTANQLTSLSYDLGATNLGTLTYTYDTAGNRTAVGGSWARTGIPAALSGATYDAANRISSWGTASLGYDLNGNLTSDGLTSYTWNARNQLTGLSGGTSASVAYDSVGRRRSKTIGGTATNFFYDGPNSVQELSGSTPTANMLTGSVDEIFTRTDAGGTSTFLADGLGSPLELADGAGALQTHYTYEPFGATTAAGTASTNTQQFTGRENDGTGLYYYRARYFHPQLQRFVAEDPLGFNAGDVNLSAYVGNQPTGFRDPTGLLVWRWVPPPWCQPPKGRKDPDVPFWLRWTCTAPPPVIPFVPDLVPPGPLFPWWPTPPSAPPGEPPTFPGWDPTEPPPGFPEWRGPDAPGGPRGGYNGPGGSMSPDVGHGPPIGPHWDWVDPVTGAPWRIYPPLPPGVVPK